MGGEKVNMEDVHTEKSERLRQALHSSHDYPGNTILACQPSVLTQRSIHHQKSSSDSPFHANTGTPAGNKAHIITGKDSMSHSSISAHYTVKGEVQSALKF